jgi:hypothetical protein
MMHVFLLASSVSGAKKRVIAAERESMPLKIELLARKSGSESFSRLLKVTFFG